MGNAHERHGKIDQAKGKVKQAVAAVTGDDCLKAEGQIDEAVGNVKDAVGRTHRKFGNAIERTAKAVKT